MTRAAVEERWKNLIAVGEWWLVNLQMIVFIVPETHDMFVVPEAGDWFWCTCLSQTLLLALIIFTRLQCCSNETRASWSPFGAWVLTVEMNFKYVTSRKYYGSSLQRQIRRLWCPDVLWLCWHCQQCRQCFVSNLNSLWC